MVLSSPTLGHVYQHIHWKVMPDRTTDPCSIQGGPCHSQGSALGQLWGELSHGAHQPMKLQAAGDVLDQAVW